MTKVMLHDKLLHPSDYLAAIEFLGKDVTLTITAIAREDLVMQGGIKDNKPVFRFSETDKKFICNKTNASSIASMYGDKAEEWVGKRITFYPTMIGVGKEMKACIRVREVVPTSTESTKSENGDNGQAKPEDTKPPVDNGAALFADDPSKPRPKQQKLPKQSEVDRRLIELACIIIDSGAMHDLDAKKAALNWLGDRCVEKEELLDNDKFKNAKSMMSELSKDDWLRWKPKQPVEAK